MPDRIVRAGILGSDAVNKLSWPAEVFYRRLMSVVDDFGRYDGRLSVLRASLYPLKLDRVSEPDIAKWMGECSEAVLVRGYVVSSKSYVEILKFDQRLRQKRSKWPAPDNPLSIAVNSPPLAAAFVSVSDTVSDSESASKGGPGGTVPQAELAAEPAEPSRFELIEQLKREIGAHFKRPEGQWWGCEEERLLVEVSKSPTVIDEWHTILSHRSGAPDAYHRQTVCSLLEHWAGELDKARNYDPTRALSDSKIGTYRDELKRLDREIDTLEKSYDGHQQKSPEDREKLKRWKARRAELIKALGMQV